MKAHRTGAAAARLAARRIDWLVVAVLALAFAVRVYRLDAQSLWNDEGNSVALAQRSLSAIASGAAHDIHPPLYYFLLHFWTAFAGYSEFSLRFLSVVAGVLLVAVTWRIARRLFGAPIGLLAALFSALSAFQLYYSQETRMYILVALWSALSVWALVAVFGSPFPQRGKRQSPEPKAKGRGWGFRSAPAWAAYVAATLAALYTHYFAFSLVLFENLAFLAWLALAWRSSQAARPAAALAPALLRWIIAQAVVAAGFLPWLFYAGNQLTTWPAISQPLSPLELAGRLLSAFVLGLDSPTGSELVPVALLGLMFLLGLLPPYGRRGAGVLLALFWAVAPLAALYLVSLRRPAYDPKFLLLSTPGFYLLVARGVMLPLRAPASRRASTPRALPAAAGLLLAGLVLDVSLTALSGVYSDPRLQRDDYRGVIEYINRLARPDDAVLVDAPGQMDVFNYYYRGAAEVQALPVGRPLDRTATETALFELTTGHKNLFAVFWATQQADPENFIERYLSRAAHQGLDAWHGNIRLAQYAVGVGADAPLQQIYNLRFGDEIELVLAYRGRPEVQPGRVYPLLLLWHALKSPAANYKVFVHLLDRQGRIVSQRDSEPQDGFRPTSGWMRDERVEDYPGLLIPEHAPAGDYSIELGLYRPEDGARLPLSSGGDSLFLGVVRVVR